jgi:DNA excision repair protein ERCC-4
MEYVQTVPRDTAEIPTLLPALRSLGDLAEASPVILIDSREQQPLRFERLASKVATLQSGDYSILGAQELFAVERKAIPDLVACCVGENRERLSRELHRLRGYRFKRLIIIGTEAQILAGQYRSNVKPQAVIGNLAAFEVRYDIPVVYCATPEIAARQVERWIFYFCRELIEAVNDLRRSTPAQNNAEITKQT